jgi:hypothetical protein
MRAVSGVHRRAWEERCKLDRAVRRKYGLDDDYEIEPELLVHPIPASHARHHYRQVQAGQHAGERRANRRKRRAKDYKPSHSSLALSVLAEDITLNDEEAEKLRLMEEEAELRRLANIVATEVGYLYFVGDLECAKDWSDDIEQSNMSLIYKKAETDTDMGQLDEDRFETKKRAQTCKPGYL